MYPCRLGKDILAQNRHIRRNALAAEGFDQNTDFFQLAFVNCRIKIRMVLDSRKYPKLREALSRRCAVYNEQLEMVEQMEDEGKIIVIRPLKPVMVDRIERDVQKLTEFYEEGYDCARNLFEV